MLRMKTKMETAELVPLNVYPGYINYLRIDSDQFKSSRSKGVFDDNFSYFSSKPYVVTPC